MGIGRHILVLRVRHDSVCVTTLIGISHLILFLFRAKGKVYNMNTIYIIILLRLPIWRSIIRCNTVYNNLSSQMHVHKPWNLPY